MFGRNRRPSPAPATVPSVPLYNPNQHAPPPQWPQQNYQQPPNFQTTPPPQQYPPQNQYGGTTGWYNQTQQVADNYQQNRPPQNQYWQQPQGFSNIPLNQSNPPVQPLNQSNIPPNQTNPQFMQRQYPQQFYQGYQQNYPDNNPYQQVNRATPNSQQDDSWNWGWGEEPNNSNNNLVNNHNKIEDSFGNQDDAWNWTIDDSNSSSSASNSMKTELKPEIKPVNPEFAHHNTVNTLPQIPLENNQPPAVFEQMGPLAVKHRTSPPSNAELLKTQTFLKQESTDSQISHESTSDELLQTSEEKILSRSSTISQCPSLPPQDFENSENEPIENQELESFDDNTIQSQIAEVRHAIENLALQQNFENKEIVSPETSVRKPPNITPPPKNISPPLNQEGVNPFKRNPKVKSYAVLGNQESEVNLETVPDNAERLDQIPETRTQNRRLPPPIIPKMENLEVAPKNDRNQYLETGQLSESYLPEYQNDTLFESNAEEPPPGLRRMVLGHTENEIPSNPDSEEPRILTGLDRVIDGEPEDPPNANTIPFTIPQDNNDELPAGLHRMVPGESSSPESNARWGSQNNFFRPANFDTEDAELENIEGNLPAIPTQRSETIGADTPPTQNDSNSLETIEPVPTEIDVQTTVRSQTDGENTKDSNLEPTRKVRPQRTDSSEDDHEVRETSVDRRRAKSPRSDRKYYRGESPDRYWERKDRRRRDRYYEEDTDYYSDKERRRPPKDSRDFDRSYSSLRRGEHREGREYDRMYSSLRREYDRSKPRGERQGGPRSEYDMEDRARRDDYYYGRYEDDYYGRDSRSSRPSSRSDSNYRDHRPKMDPYNSYYQGYGYDHTTGANAYYAAHYQQHYQYYENLRRTNPAAYADWYRKYMQGISSAHGMNQGPPSSGDQLTSRTHEDKASVHSGRSSANEELHKNRYHRYYSGGVPTDAPHMGGYYSQPHAHSYSQDDSRVLDQTDSSLNLESADMTIHRLTPAKFSTAHIKANISSGHFIQVLPHYPIDGQPPIVEILDLQTLLADDPEQQELIEYPGPLIKGVTHKKTLIEFCETKIKRALAGANFEDRESYVLMWELLILLLRQNGVVVGTDIAELLMKSAQSAPVTSSRRASVVSSVNSIQEESPQLDLTDDTSIPNLMSKSSALSETYVTNKFREYLIYGSGKEALEWAMKNGLWGHALFLASKLDKRTYASVMMRFANGLTINDPLQTLYQLLSGRQPAAVTCVSDEKWGDWRPHLAMILSNTSHRPELDRKAITTLGDTLNARGSLYAAHFCYLMAQTGFGNYGSKSSRLVLLGSSHQRPFFEFATNEAIIMTEVYEYACSLSDPSFNIAEFQSFKYLMATKLAERGFLERALSYAERIGIVITQNPTRHSPAFAMQIVALAERLRARDTLADITLGDDNEDSDGENNVSSGNIEWIANLKTVLSDYDMGLLTQDTQSLSNLASSELDITQSVTPPTDQVVQQQQPPAYESTWNQQQQQQPQQQPQFYQPDYSQQQQQSKPSWNNEIPVENTEQWNESKVVTEYQQPPVSNEYQEQQNQYWNQQQWGGDSNLNQQPQDDYWNGGQSDLEKKAPIVKIKEEPPAKPILKEDTPKPQITMPNSSTGMKAYNDDDESSMTQNQSKPAPPVSKKDGKPGTTNSGWFGGIWNKLSLRPKNQMILPDDKNPTIVWDSDKKKWVNLDGDSNENNTAARPPPKMTDMFAPQVTQPPQIPQQGSQPQSLPTQFPTQNNLDLQSTDAAKKPPAVPNMFKMQRGRGKKAYVDVFNPNGIKGPSSLPPAVNVLGSVAPTPQMNYFVPAPIADPNAPVNFLTPTGAIETTEDNSQISRWSSSSSLSREVQHYMVRSKHPVAEKPKFKTKLKSNGPVPGMYNPSQYSQGITMGNQYSQ